MSPMPSNSPATTTGGPEQQNPQLFNELTERQEMPQTVATINGLAKSQRLQIEKVGCIARTRLFIKVKFKTKSASKPILNPGFPWKMLREIGLECNGVTGIIQCGAVTLQQRRDRVYRNPVTAIFKGPKGGEELAAATEYESLFMVEVPLAHDMESLIGILLAQNEETQLSYSLNWASEEEILHSGEIEGFEGEVLWENTVFSIGSTVVGKQEVTVLPDLSAFHGLTELETPLVGTGNRRAELVRTSGQLLAYTARVQNGAGGKEQLAPGEWQKFAIEYGGNKDPLVWTGPPIGLLEQNAADYDGALVVGGMDFVVYDTEADNPTRDMIMPESLTELRATVGIPSGFTASNALIVTSQETLYPAV